MTDKRPNTSEAGAAPVVVKKYANRRLYNTQNSAYVTLDNLSDMVRAGQDFVVQDARTGEDITRAVLTQIIFEQENRGQNLLPVQFLRRLIRLYGDSMQGFLPAYLEMSIETFAKSREQMREQFQRALSAAPGMSSFEEQARQNMALFQEALRLWAPFATGASPTPPAPPSAQTAEADSLSELKRQVEQMQRQLEQIASARKPEGR